MVPVFFFILLIANPTPQRVLGTKKRESELSNNLIDERRQKKEVENASKTRKEKQEMLEEYSIALKVIKKYVKRVNERYF